MAETSEVRLIRHGRKLPIHLHVSGLEAGLDPTGVSDISQYGRELPTERYRGIVIGSSPVPRSSMTRKIIVEELSGNVTTGIDTRLATYRGTVNLLSPEMSRLWGQAEKDHQTAQGVAKEDRGLAAWAAIGLDNPNGDGITLREVAYTFGAYVLERAKGNQLTVGVTHSGYLEFFLYTLLGSERTCMEHMQATGGALRPLTGLQIQYKEGADHFLLERPRLRIPGQILEAQVAWLTQHGIADQIYERRVRL